MCGRSRSPSPRREKSRRRSRSRSRSRSRERKGLADMSYEQYLEAFEKVFLHIVKFAKCALLLPLLLLLCALGPL